MLVFEQTDHHAWNARSALSDNNSSFFWDIEVLSDGTFSIAGSSSGLLKDQFLPKFERLRDAVEWCNAQEAGPTKKCFECRFTNLTEEQATTLADWYYGQGEQNADIWFDEQKVELPIVDRVFATADNAVIVKCK